jgi:CHAT domain-containing protein
VLVTAQPDSSEDDADLAVLRDTDWLGNRFALVTLPSVASLQSLRHSDTTHEAAFIGFGDPLFAAQRATDASARGHIDSFFRGVTAAGNALANTSALSALARLPGTRSELEAMAAALGDDSAVLLGADATETAVKRTRLSADVLAFATHGLVAGEIHGLAEPGLVFTPPETATPDDDGILTASEVAQLDLDVDWLVLSACNTAAADGSPGAEPLSGLARAFLYAGARSLLVSHWPVYDRVTAQLTVQTLAHARAKPRAEALQAAMTAIRTGVDAAGAPVPGWHPSWSHPAAWAPFVLVSSE